MRWENEAEVGAQQLGWEVVDRAGIDDYQGWGVLLLKRYGTEWGVLPWTYGSCNYCDQYEDQFTYGLSDQDFNEACVRLFGSLIESADSEEAARLLFDSRKGW